MALRALWRRSNDTSNVHAVSEELARMGLVISTDVTMVVALVCLCRYKLLKKLLKLCSPGEPNLAACEARFFDELRQQMQAANRLVQACRQNRAMQQGLGMLSPS